jgi:hypothetical protein
MVKKPNREEMIAEMVRLAPSCLVGDILFYKGGRYRLVDTPESVLTEVWKYTHDQECQKVFTRCLYDLDSTL